MAAGPQRISVPATQAGVKLASGTSREVSKWMVQISGTLTNISFTFKGRQTLNANLSNSDNQTIGYTTPTSTTVVTTAITAAGIFWVIGDGMDLYADVTVTAGGPVQFDVLALNG